MEERVRHAILCPLCDSYYFGYREDDKEKICPQCAEERREIEDEYLKEKGTARM